MNKQRDNWKGKPHQVRNTAPRLTPEQKQQLVLDTVNGATIDEPLTLKGVSARANISMDDVRFYCDRLLDQKQISMKMIPDSFYPQQRVRAFYRKF